MKKTPTPLRLESDLKTEIDTLAEKTGLSQADLMRMILKAGVRAIKENNYKFSVPFQMRTIREDIPAKTDDLLQERIDAAKQRAQKREIQSDGPPPNLKDLKGVSRASIPRKK